MSTYTVKYNKSSYHIDGLPTRTKSTGNDNGTGTVAYYSETICGALTRGRFSNGAQADTVTEILAAARLSARNANKNVCRNCTKAAEDLIAQGA